MQPGLDELSADSQEPDIQSAHRQGEPGQEQEVAPGRPLKVKTMVFEVAKQVLNPGTTVIQAQDQSGMGEICPSRASNGSQPHAHR